VNSHIFPNLIFVHVLAPCLLIPTLVVILCNRFTKFPSIPWTTFELKSMCLCCICGFAWFIRLACGVGINTQFHGFTCGSCWHTNMWVELHVLELSHDLLPVSWCKTNTWIVMFICTNNEKMIFDKIWLSCKTTMLSHN